MCFLWVTLPEDTAKQHDRAKSSEFKVSVAGHSELVKVRELPKH